MPPSALHYLDHLATELDTSRGNIILALLALTKIDPQLMEKARARYLACGMPREFFDMDTPPCAAKSGKESSGPCMCGAASKC